MSLIQMDASVSPGNSGGGLFNMNGELVGIVNAKSSSSDAEGLGFAIPVNDAVKVAQELLENGYVTGRPYLGITYLAVTDAQTASQLGVNAYGVYVVEVVKGGPADKAGFKAGDRIVSVDGSEVATQRRPWHPDAEARSRRYAFHHHCTRRPDADGQCYAGRKRPLPTAEQNRKPRSG